MRAALAELVHVALAAELGELRLHRRCNSILQSLVGRPCANHVAKVPTLFAKETISQLAVGGDSQPVASSAKGIGHARDDPDAAPPAGNAPEARSVVRRVRRQALGRPGATLGGVLLNGLNDIGLGDKPICAPPVLVKRHELEESHLDWQILCEVHEAPDLLLIHAAQDDAVDLDVEWGVVSEHSVQRIHHPAMELLVAPDEQRELRRHQRVEAHVDVVQPRRAHIREELRQAHPIRRDAEGKRLIEAAVDLAEVLDDARKVAADGGLAARQANLAHAPANEQADQARQLRRGKDVAGGARLGGLLALLRSAVLAAQVAPVRQRHPEVPMLPSEFVHQARVHTGPCLGDDLLVLHGKELRRLRMLPVSLRGRLWLPTTQVACDDFAVRRAARRRDGHSAASPRLASTGEPRKRQRNTLARPCGRTGASLAHRPRQDLRRPWP
mmetsp:Transcript_62091/g.178643  ORF Transcript_62091/g.178643 Transcript_62091/m.178643 type:complete len:442 (+) Transcript_62091:98-1423(+)